MYEAWTDGNIVSNNRPLTEDEKVELDELNKNINDAIKKRSEWLDAKMVETSTLKVGDDIYDINKGIKVGVVSRLYRYWKGRNDLLDESHYCNYEYKTMSGHNDNTSRQIGVQFGSLQEAVGIAEWNAAVLNLRNEIK